MKKKVLFIGTFVSKKIGTKGIAESLSERLKEEGVTIKLSSTYKIKYFIPRIGIYPGDGNVSFISGKHIN
jgi:hypothetical protein